MEGTAASRSTRFAAGRRSHWGEYSVMKRATQTPTGTAIAMAMSELTTVVHSSSTMPNLGWSPPTSHSREVKKLASFLASAGTAWETRNTPMRVTRATTSTPAPRAVPPNTRSPSRRVPARSDAGRWPCGSGTSSVTDTSVTEDITPTLVVVTAQTSVPGQPMAPTAVLTLVARSAGSGA